nr:hypothetical protein [Tanacetum cinerariifolium]
MIFDGMLRNLDNGSGKFIMYPRFIQTFLDKQLDGLPTHKEKYDVSFHTKKVFAYMKRIVDGPRHQDTIRDTSAHTRRVKKLEKKYKSRTHKLKRLYKVGLTARVISSSDNEALNKEDTSKQGRIDEIDDDEDISLVSTHDDIIVQDEGIEDVDEEEVVEVVTTAKMIIDIVVDVAHVTTAIVDIPVSPAETIVTTTPTITTESTKTNVKAKVEADYELAQRLQAEEQEQLIDAEKANLFMKFLEKRRMFFAAKRAEENRNKHPTKTQQRILMNDGDEVTIDATPLSSKSPTIVDYEIYKERKKNYFQIFRADGNSQMYLTFSKLLKNFDRKTWKFFGD